MMTYTLHVMAKCCQVYTQEQEHTTAYCQYLIGIAHAFLAATALTGKRAIKKVAQVLLYNKILSNCKLDLLFVS